MEIKLIKAPAEADWLLAYECALLTIGKKAIRRPTEKWKRAILRARHSPIRELKFMFLLTDIPYYVTGHLCRHVHSRPYVGSQRNDRQDKYDRRTAPQDAPVSMIWSMEAEELLHIANKRLCGKADAVTREVVREMCRRVVDACPEFSEELVPMCVHNGGVCHEMFPCGRSDIKPSRATWQD